MLLSAGATAVTLPDDLEWTDEYAWAAVEQATEYTITGSLVVDVGARAKGRPVTLEASDSRAWVDRATVEQLRAWSNTPGLSLTLTLADARVLNVMFRHQDGPGLEAEPVLFMAPAENDDRYIITLNLMET